MLMLYSSIRSGRMRDHPYCITEDFGSNDLYPAGAPFGTPEEVSEEVRRRIVDLEADGGLAVKPENICAMFEEARKYGSYSTQKGLSE
jgi:hypothetical protein